jgi:hypothetical protein
MPSTLPPTLPLVPHAIATTPSTFGFYYEIEGAAFVVPHQPGNSMSNINATASTTLVGQMEAAQATQGLTDQRLCDLLGIERGIALTLIKAGTMKMPITKIPALAKALKLDAPDLMRIALRESSPGLAEAIEDALNPMHLSATEVNLIKHLRELSGGQAGTPIVIQGKAVIALVAV